MRNVLLRCEVVSIIGQVLDRGSGGGDRTRMLLAVMETTFKYLQTHLQKKNFSIRLKQ